MSYNAEGCGGSLVAAILIAYILMPVLAINAMTDYEDVGEGKSVILIWTLISLIISSFLLFCWASGNRDKKNELKALNKKLDNAMRKRDSLKSSNSS